MLREVLDGFNRHDLDAIMAHFGEDCVFETPRGPDRWGRRFVGQGRGAPRAGGALRGHPGRPATARTITSPAANRGVSEWTISGTTTEGVRIDVRGCDIWTFGDDGKIVRKDSFWKLREA